MSDATISGEAKLNKQLVRGGIRKLAENRVTIDILHVLEQSGYDVGQVLRYSGARPPVYFSE